MIYALDSAEMPDFLESGGVSTEKGIPLVFSVILSKLLLCPLIGDYVGGERGLTSIYSVRGLQVSRDGPCGIPKKSLSIERTGLSSLDLFLADMQGYTF